MTHTGSHAPLKVTAVYVTSLNGNFTKDGQTDVQDWASGEDHEHFSALIARHEVLVMGRNTYEAKRSQPEPGRLRVVLTDNPSHYAQNAVPKQLEFVSATATQLLQRLQARGYKNILLVGGSVNTQFLDAGLVDELWLTVEPKIFGRGKQLFAGAQTDPRMRLLSCKQLNKQGTILLHYLIERPTSVTLST